MEQLFSWSVSPFLQEKKIAKTILKPAKIQFLVFESHKHVCIRYIVFYLIN